MATTGVLLLLLQRSAPPPANPAALRSYLDIVRLLLRKGAPVWVTDKVHFLRGGILLLPLP